MSRGGRGRHAYREVELNPKFVLDLQQVSLLAAGVEDNADSLPASTSCTTGTGVPSQDKARVGLETNRCTKVLESSGTWKHQVSSPEKGIVCTYASLDDKLDFGDINATGSNIGSHENQKLAGPKV